MGRIGKLHQTKPNHTKPSKMLGKRKRSAVVVSRATGLESALDHSRTEPRVEAQDVFKQYFEAQFEPLPGLALRSQGPEEEYSSDEDSQDSQWNGFSDAETAVNHVEVIEHGLTTGSEDVVVDNTEVKTFMVSQCYRSSRFRSDSVYSQSTKPPTAGVQSAKISTQSQTKDDEREVTNLKNDLDLQRLLQESSLLKRAKHGSKADRHRTTDLRLQSLGLKSSLYSQEKMPIAHRLGMKAKAASREDLRRKDARENGIILEKASKKPSSDRANRERGVDAPGLGRFRGGTLKLSRRDVADIQGPKQNIRGGRRR
jgi:hypothetical protein